ncbi:hypothetical protein PAECIP111893_01245 [Paenibacillus plantiphilus]|uniref:Copper amine oxidase-like N-terminal domain-containing protein n=1 Tax=Paenibacillus plantiphilus TaxID=2905650 RepID=A0ABM9C190_9BACL|nr:hypothetical protein [Paenibacillus plantiphilus]CAH1199153.1 hypothetical protein PAECIP111893_01245 [Paenibacillus plantiphilus]
MKDMLKIFAAVVSITFLLGSLTGCGTMTGSGNLDTDWSKNMEVTQIRTLIDGEPLESSKAVMKDGRKRFVPLQEVLEQLGFKVESSPGLIEVIYQTPIGKIDFTSSQPMSFGTTYLHLDNEEDIRMVGDVAYIDMYRLEGVSSAEVVWDEDASTIIITSGDPDAQVEPPTYEDIEERPELSGEESMKANYGKYGSSPTLDALSELYEELDQEGYDVGSVLGFYPDYHHSGYTDTPLDVVTFGWRGIDGEHYGFLTDFGMASNLEEAPIVLVIPTYPSVVVANNIREFLRIAMIDSNMVYFEYQDEQDYLDQMEEIGGAYFEGTGETRAYKRLVLERLEAKLHPPIIRDPYTYSKQVRAERENRILVPTQDKLGIVNVHPADQGQQHEGIVLDEDIGLKELETFLKSATYAEKLALIRDYHFNLESYFYHEDGIDEAIMREMERMGLHDEIARMNAIY